MSKVKVFVTCTVPKLGDMEVSERILVNKKDVEFFTLQKILREKYKDKRTVIGIGVYNKAGDKQVPLEEVKKIQKKKKALIL